MLDIDAKVDLAFPFVLSTKCMASWQHLSILKMNKKLIFISRWFHLVVKGEVKNQ